MSCKGLAVGSLVPIGKGEGLRDKANAESFSDVAERGMSVAYCSLGSQK